MDKFITILQAVLRKPGMFRIHNIEDLYLFTLGYSIACADVGDETVLTFINSFSDFISAEYELSERTEWNRYIRFISGGDMHSLDLFKINFIDYCNENNVVWPD